MLDITGKSNEAADNNFAPPAITLPKGGGAIRGMGEKFAANPVTGTGSITVPIATTPGRAGFGPQLSLSYDSGAGNGAFGLGWNLSLPNITRKTDKGLPKYQDYEESDTFILSDSEDLVPVLFNEGGEWVRKPVVRSVNGVAYQVQRYRPRVEGLFARIERWVNQQSLETHWRSITRDNITTLYGKTAESRIADPADPRRVFSWLICESYDDKGNVIRYEYASEDSTGIAITTHERNRTDESRSANRHLKRVKYGNLPSRLVEPDLAKMHWLFEVVFDYGEGHYEQLPVDSRGRQLVRALKGESQEWIARQDPFSSYRAGFEVRTYRLCQRVLMFHHFPEELGTDDYLVRATEFNYTESTLASFISEVTQSGYIRNPDGTYLKKSLPPIEFEYSQAIINERVREIDAESLENLPYGLDGSRYRWVDLDGEGIPGILTEQGTTWFYKANLGGGRFGAQQVVTAKPSLSALNTGSQQLLDLAGDGKLDLVQLNSPAPGFYERTEDQLWEPFTPFASLPNIPFDDPNLRFVDLTGDGHADVLITEHEAFKWYPSLAEEGFGRAEKIRQALDEERGARLIFADSTQSIFLADMSGDGLSDLVRINNGEVCYWPNLGYGRFGAKVSMDDAPRFDMPDLFDQRRIQLADIDGSGVSDIIYLGSDGIRLYFNQSGNSWSRARTLPQFPRTDNLSLVTVADLLGNGTACIVWSSPLPGYARQPMRYIDLMGGKKPHLMVGMKNNMGAETRLQYVSSTKFYLADKEEGRPWITKLPFPVNVVERVETLDHISRNRFVTRYAYHHGHFDGVEREFRGFGMVEQQDTEEFASLSASVALSDAVNIDAASHVPPILTKTWFHTGVGAEGERVSRHFEHEYYREPGLSDAELAAQLLPDTMLPSHLNEQQRREAQRALKGSILRQETYALDGAPQSLHPYTVSERNYTVEQLQPLADNPFAVFFTHQRETIDYRYERNPVDPRISHALTLEVDAFGNVLRSAAVGYGRRRADGSLTTEDQARQAATLIAFTENQFTNAVELDDAYRAPLLCEVATFELTGLKADSGGRFDFNVVDAALINAAEIASEAQPAGGLQKRLVERTRALYRRNNLDGALPLGQLESLALPFETYKQAFTPSLLQQVYQTRATDERLANDGSYVHSEGDENWWAASGRIFFSRNSAATGAEEFELAREHFFQPLRFNDPFGNATTVSYDAHHLMTTETRDALGSAVRSENDYRLVQPRLVTDANGNRAGAAFDALGIVVGTAVMGKESESLGDSLEGFERDLDDATIIAHLQDPFTSPHEILKRASTAIVYDLRQYHRSSATGNPQPNVVYTLTRETHDAELSPGEHTLIQHSFSYSDGFGREIQKKMQAEPGPVSRRDANGNIIVGADNQPELTPEDVSPRWVGSGWTVFNNKGKPVRRYEPFFADTHRFEFDVRVGVSPVLFYDPLERLVATLHPNHTWDMVVFDTWRQESWDVNDTVLISDPRTDANVGDFFRRLPDADYLPTWYMRRHDGALGSHEAEAARKASLHSNTPTIAQFDSLGRTFLTTAHNRLQRSDSADAAQPADEFYATRVVLGLKGNQLEITDAHARVVMRYDYNLLGNRIHQSSMEAGESWTLNDVVGKPIYAWDSRNNQFRTTYDALRRPICVYLREEDRPESLVGRTIYGEGQPDAESSNLRGKVFEHYDQAGVVTSHEYDFKSNLLHSQRRLAQDYKTTLDWSTAVALEEKTYVARTRYDALNRPKEQTTPDNSVIRSRYNEANLLERVDANLRAARVDDQPVWTPFINDIDYNAKGQRTFIEYGNGVKTSYKYDPYIFRLVHLLTRRNDADFTSDCPSPGPAGWPGCQVQNLRYTYDPAGNVTHVRDDAQQTIYFRNKRVEPSADYTYDAIYQLIEARGREHLGQTASAPSRPTPPDAFDFHTGLDHPGDGNAMGEYVERYVYDAVGNILALQHRGSDPTHAGWTRAYAYNEASQLEAGRVNNRLSHTTVGATTETYRYEGAAGLHGNITSMPHLPLMQWDYRNQVRATSQQVVKNGGTPETTWYVYDGDGNRVRKVTEGQAAAGKTPARRRERIYLLGFEIYREYENDGNTVALERETLHVTGDKQRIALVESRTDAASSESLIRYHLKNHLASASLELDGAANIISYEEFYPYGSTSYQAVNKNIKAAAKRYRYTGKERDEESGFYYHGARYYASWLGRWTSVDPALLNAKEGQRLDQPYQYVGNRPLVAVDPDGRLFWFVVIVAATALVTIESDANAPTNAEQARNAKPAVTDFEFAARTGVLAASFLAGGGFTQSLLRSGSSKVVAYGGGGAVSGLAAPADLAVTDAFRGEMSSFSDYATRTAVGVGGGGLLGGAIGGASRIISGPQKLPTSSYGGSSASGTGGGAPPALEASPIVSETADVGGYVFRGTTVGFPGNPALQRIQMTPVSTDPAVATLFGTEAANFGEGVLLVSPARGLPITQGNVLSTLEAELGVQMAPLEFAQTAQSVSLPTARAALSEIGVNIPGRIPNKAALDAAIKETPRMTSEQIAEFLKKIF